MKGNFDSIINENRPVIVDFHAVWCGPCKTQSPILKQVAEELGERVKVIKIDVDQNQMIASRYQIQSVPTLMIFKNGEIKHKQAGVHTKAQLISILNELLKI
jgi:thioredoxin 1